MSIRLVRLSTGDDGESHFAEGEAPLSTGADTADATAVARIMFAESPAGSSLAWHNAPCRQYVVTLSGTLEFENRHGEACTIHPGDVLLAEDVDGGGHRWRLVDDQPWRRVYVTLADQDRSP